MKLFVDTTYNNIHMILFNDNIVESKKVRNIIKISDVFNDELEALLIKNKLNLTDITELYLTIGPGSFTGVRVACTFAKTLMILNKELKVYKISSLFYQAGSLDAISYIDAKGGNTYFAVYQDSKEIIADQILDAATAVQIANEFEGFSSYYDMTEFDYENNLMELLNYFKKVDDIDSLEPVYIKNHISNN